MRFLFGTGERVYDVVLAYHAHCRADRGTCSFGCRRWYGTPVVPTVTTTTVDSGLLPSFAIATASVIDFTILSG